LANVPSAEKRNRQRIKRRARNLSHLVPMRTRVKKARTALGSAKDAPDAVGPAVATAISQVARAAQKGVIHKKTAARKISRLAKAVNKAKQIIAAAQAAAKTATAAGTKPAAKKPAAKKPAAKK
jgi:small subunit ribosomal protein S20